MRPACERDTHTDTDSGTYAEIEEGVYAHRHKFGDKRRLRHCYTRCDLCVREICTQTQIQTQTQTQTQRKGDTHTDTDLDTDADTDIVTRDVT